jgi:hypothetical protein
MIMTQLVRFDDLAGPGRRIGDVVLASELGICGFGLRFFGFALEGACERFDVAPVRIRVPGIAWLDGSAYFIDKRGIACGVERERFPSGRGQKSGQGNGGQVPISS